MTNTDIRQSSETHEDYRFMLLKTEKLSVAIHIVTGHLSAQEPLREDMRRAALKLVKDMRVLVSGEKGSIVSDTTHLKIGADAIISALYVAKSAKMISAGNAEILEREYLELGNYFTRSQMESLEIETTALQIDARKMSEAKGPALSMRQVPVAKRHSATAVPAQSKNNYSGKSQPDGLSRRELILNIIEGKNAYSLGDIASRVKGVSEKTIQRDLLSLVADKVLKKTGERRWSRYARI